MRLSTFIWIVFIILTVAPGVIVHFSGAAPADVAAYLLPCGFRGLHGVDHFADRAVFCVEGDEKSFYLGDMKVALFPTLATFCATWMSPLACRLRHVVLPL
ncbi:MAG: hypothetical protein ACLUEQ_02830 [Cloacibacillus evryensis]